VNEKYRQSLRPYVWVVGLPFGGVTLFMAIKEIFTQYDNPAKLLSDLTALITIFGGLACVVLMLIYIALWIWRVSISPSFLVCTTLIGINRKISWKSILSVEEANYEGIRYLKIKSSETQLKLWLPLNLLNIERFIERVINYAGKDNPLTEWFLTPKDEPIVV